MADSETSPGANVQIVDCHANWCSHDGSSVQKKLSPEKHGPGLRGALRDSFVEHGVKTVVVIGLEHDGEGEYPSRHARSPMGLEAFRALSSALQDTSFRYVAGINPYGLDGKALRTIEETVESGECVGLKIFLGYYRVPLLSAEYAPLFTMADSLGLPVLVHTGHLYEDGPVNETSHPCRVEEAAARFWRSNWVACHMGAPLYGEFVAALDRQENLFGDTAGLSAAYEDAALDSDLARLAQSSKGRSRILFGSDWPFFDVGKEIAAVKDLFPETAHEDVLAKNAKRVFRLRTEAEDGVRC